MQTLSRGFRLIILPVVIVNIIGFLLRVNGLDTYCILSGFRLQLSFVLPFFIALNEDGLSLIKNALTRPSYNKNWQPLFWIFFPFIVLSAVLYFAKIINVGDPEYFYEFGLSSVFDLPIYFLWNFPQLLLFALYLVMIRPYLKGKTAAASLVIIALMAYRFIPFGKGKFDYPDFSVLVFAALSAGLVVKYFMNIYWFCIVFFMIFWLNLLAFGTNSQIMLHMLFAAEYDKWEGFFDVGRAFYRFILPAQLIITFTVILMSSFTVKNKI